MTAALAGIEGFVDGGGHHVVVAVKPEFVRRAQDEKEFARVLVSADLCLADGSGVVWAARRQGCALARPVTGVDLIPPLAALSARRRFRLFLLGAAPGVADELAALLRDQHPDLHIPSHSGSPDPASDPETVA